MHSRDTDLEDLAARFRRSTPAALRRRVRAIASWTREAGGRCALVGGPVRDLLMGAGNIDIDLAVEADVRALVRRAEAEWGCVARYFDAFETATLLFDDGSKIDLARTRTETYARSGALPDVTPASLDDDLPRRDFTINAMALVVRGEGFAHLLDPFDGRADLARGQIRALHAASFLDDPTRIYRAARFAGRFRFRVEAKTARWILAAIASFAPANVSAARLAREIRLILTESNPVPALRFVRRFRVEQFVSPELDLDASSLARVIRADAVRKRLGASLDLDDLAMRAIALAWERPECEVREWLISLGVAPSAARKLAADVGRSSAAKDDLSAKARNLRDDRLLACDGIRDEALAVLAASATPTVRSRVARYWALRPTRIVHLTGGDLLAMGISPGPPLGKVLADLRRAVWRGDAGGDRESQRLWMEWKLNQMRRS